METAILEFSDGAERIEAYRQLAEQGRAFEVVYSGNGFPASTAFRWVYTGTRSGRPKGFVKRWLALREALRNADARQWVAVRPSSGVLVALMVLAERHKARLALWLDEEDLGGWFLYVVARAAGLSVDADFWQNGIGRMYDGTHRETGEEGHGR